MDELDDILEVATKEQAVEILKGLRFNEIMAKAMKELLKLDNDIAVTLTVGELELDIISNNAVLQFIDMELNYQADCEENIIATFDVTLDEEE